MKLTYKSSKITYKSLFGYSLVIIALLVVAVPVFANTTPGNNLLDFSFNDNTGYSPQSARPLSRGINVNHLNPGEENWYLYSRDSFDDPGFSWVSLAMRYQSEALINTEQVNFEIFAQEQTNSWFQQQTEVSPTTLGMGLRSPLKTSNQSLIESFWTGHVAESERYYVRVFNNSPFGLDYTLEAKAEQPAVSGAIPASINAAAGNAVPLNARQMAWTLTAQAVNNMPAEQAAGWMKNAQAVGWIVTEGTLPQDAPQPSLADRQTLWDLTAQAIAGQDAETASRWLIQADSLGWLAIPFNIPKDPNADVTDDNPGGEDDDDSEPPAQPVQPDPVYSPVNIYPNNPLILDLNNVNSGRLAPYGEHWYELTRDDFDDELIEDMALTMFFTPSQGFISNRINFELFPGSQYHIWARGDSDYMDNFGLGLWVSRDEDPLTGERLWAGSLVDGDRYFIKVKNGSPEVVDYYLFPNDVENAELGNPTLHKRDGAAGRTPYAVAPPTRPGPPPEPGESPPEAIPVKIGDTRGSLQAGEEMWYKFYYFDRYDDDTPNHDFKIYLTNTPLDDVRARHAEFEIYPGNQLHIWTRGTTDQLDPLGASSPSPNKLKNEKSLQVLWDGQLMEEHVYFIRVHNHDIGPLEYELQIKGGP